MATDASPGVDSLHAEAPRPARQAGIHADGNEDDLSRAGGLREVAAQALQILIASGGGLLFHRLGLPAAWLSGAVVATLIWGNLGFGRPMSRPVRDAAMLISGVVMGAGLTPEAFDAIARYPVSLALLVVAMLSITGGSMLWLTWIAGWRRDDALLASIPGSLVTVLVVAADRGAAVSSIIIVQAFRLLVLVAVLPLLVVTLGGGDGTRLIGEGQALASPLGMGGMLLLSLGLGLAFERLRVTAPILLGATVASALLHGTGIASGTIPPVIATGSLVLIGIFIAERFRGIERRRLLKLLPAAAGSLVVGGGIAALFALAASVLARIGYADALVAFAPGSLEAMMVLALVLGLDPLYVGVHHLTRFLGIGFVLPLAMGWVRNPPRQE